MVRLEADLDLEKSQGRVASKIKRLAWITHLIIVIMHNIKLCMENVLKYVYDSVWNIL